MERESIESAMRKGESHYTLKLGVDAGTDFESPEPDFFQEITYLVSQGFDKRDIFLYYIYRDIDQYQRQNKERTREECKRYLIPYLRSFREESKWNQVDLDRWEEEVLENLNVDDLKKYNDQVNPIPWEGKKQTVINDISRCLSTSREAYIFERIAEGLKKYNRLFVVYGSAHAVRQEPALKALMESL